MENKLDNKELENLKKNVVCPVELALRVVGGKWRGSILYQLQDEPLRFNELMLRVQDAVVYYDKRVDHFLSSKVLSEHLSSLQNLGMIEKLQEQDKTYYRLSQRGQSIVPLLIELFYWGEEHFQSDQLATSSYQSVT
ncbi:MAG: helix-turn-helix transcriptional regulator [Flavobacteriales bacterium]|jgi:DNA-binding HxlR family transcriptional regulator|nr:helix-turn-helix transcriptional regulator [Flavobacteriales bacterium]